MTNYTKTTDFAAKDALPSGNSAKIVKGSEIDTEFNNIATASATKANANAAALTGTTTFETISDGTIAITAFVDEDNMASNSATLLPTQQSVKAYVDSQVTAQDLDFQADSGGALSIDLDSETLTFTGGTGVDTSGSGNAVTFAIDSTVATLTGSQTLSNKTLATPVVSGNLTTDGLLDGRDVAADGTKLDGIEAGATADQTAAEIRALVESATDSNVFTDADHSKLNGIEASADVTDTANVTAAGALMDSELTSEASVKALNQGVATTDSPSFAGLTTTANISFGDNDKAIFGAGSDLQIYHSGAASYISDTGDGSLLLTGNGGDISFFDTANAAYMVRANTGGDVQISHAGTVRLATTSTGIDVTGDVSIGDGSASATRLLMGSGDDSKMFHNGTDTYWINDTGNIIIRNQSDDKDILFQTDNGSGGTTTYITVDGSETDVSLHYGGNQKLATTSTGIDVTGSISADGLTVDTDTLHVDATNNRVGIGTSSPATRLHVNSGANGEILRIQGADAQLRINNSTANVMDINSSGSGDSLTLSTNDTERMRIDSSGNLLVGTTSTSPHSSSSVEGIALRTDVGGFLGISRSGGQVASFNRISGNGDIVDFRKDGTTVGSIGSDTSNSDLYIGNGDTAIMFHDGADAIFPHNVVTNAGRDAAIDIGYSTYRFKDLYLSGISYSNTVYSDLNLTLAADYNNNSSTGNSNILFQTDGTERARLDASGNLLVGTSSTASGGPYRVTADGGNSYRPLACKYDSTSGATQIAFINPNGQVGGITTTGSATAYNTSSDQRLKDNIVDAPSASDDIDAIQVRSFDWKADGSHQKYGMVAQELQAVAPEAVHQPEDPEEMMGVDYSKLVPMLVKEIQSLRARVAQLEN